MRIRKAFVFTASKCFLLAALFVCPSPSSAADATFKDGYLLKGEIIRENGNYLCVKTDTGEFWIWKDDLAVPTDYDDSMSTYCALLKTLDASSADEQLQLAEWCKGHDLVDLCKFHMEEIIRIDPSNADAAAALGLTASNGKYVTERELNTKKGLVRCLGEWMKKDDLARYERGFVKQGGSWLARDGNEKRLLPEKERQTAARFQPLRAEADALVKQQFGEGFRADLAGRFIFRTNVPAADCKLLYQMAQDYLRQWMKDFGRDLGVVHTAPMDVYFFQTEEEYQAGTAKIEPKMADMVRGAPGFCWWTQTTRSATITMFRQMRTNTGWKYDNYIHTLFHELTHYFVTSLLEGALDTKIGTFIDEGLASFFAGIKFDENTRVFEWGADAGYYLKDARANRSKFALRSLMDESQDSFYSSDRTVKYALAEMFANYLVNAASGKHRKGILDFLKSYAPGKDGEPDRVKRLEKYIGIPLDQMEKECEKHTNSRKG